MGRDRHQVIVFMSATQRSFGLRHKERQRKTHGQMATVEVEAVPSCGVLQREGRGVFRTVIDTDSRKGMITRLGTRWKEKGTQ